MKNGNFFRLPEMHLYKFTKELAMKGKRETFEPLKTTQDIPINRNKSLKTSLMVIFIVVFSFSIGFIACLIFWPSYANTTVITAQTKQIEKQLKVEKELTRGSMLEENWIGVLEVRDNEALTVLHKRAAIGNKNGFISLKIGVSYTVHNYFVHLNTGYGIVDDGQGSLFLLVWYSGDLKAPSANPRTIRIPSGRRIETGIP
jgi:hypothetical protein